MYINITWIFQKKTFKATTTFYRKPWKKPWDFYDFEADLPCFAWRWITVAMNHPDRSKGPNPCSWTAGTSRTLRTFLAGRLTIEVGLGLGFSLEKIGKIHQLIYYKQFFELLIWFFGCLCVGFCSVVLNGSFDLWAKYINLKFWLLVFAWKSPGLKTNQWRPNKSDCAWLCQVHDEQKVEFHPFLQVLVLLYLVHMSAMSVMFLRTFIDTLEHACVYYMWSVF